MDSIKWSEKAFLDVKASLMPKITELGFESNQFIPVSGLHGHNIFKRYECKHADWYQGDSMIEAMQLLSIDIKEKYEKSHEEKVQVQIFNKTHDKNDLYVECKVLSGSINLGEKLVLLP